MEIEEKIKNNKLRRERYRRNKKKELEYSHNHLERRKLYNYKIINKDRKEYNKKKRLQHRHKKHFYPTLLKLYNGKCQVKGCNESANLELHHIIYEDGINFCLILCLKHHHILHRKY